MRFTVDAERPTKKLHNFWNHIHFHPTDAVEDDWGQRILNRVASDSVAKTVRIYAMLEDIVTMSEDGKLQYDFTLNDIRLDYMVQKGFKVLAVGNDETFFDGNIAKETEVEPNKIILRAYTTGKPTIANDKVEVNGKFYTPNN